ncbi:hypothetical protein DFP72DRAFT_482645 [Ephemerocybe angulata]|uniref:Uncharacterized protein n=1 Tax=Ephemerocybe angulata TaxID=980116 RepID=A0A8H6IDU2_9AGAR|nr:hypothetical protein DFP72DRAFT_482645 [Tulosesus angulatus]
MEASLTVATISWLRSKTFKIGRSTNQEWNDHLTRSHGYFLPNLWKLWLSSESMFEKIVKVSIHDEDRSIQVAGQELLKQLANDDRFVWDLKIDALKWIETATVLPSYRWRVRHNGVLVLETFVKRLETENKELLKKLVELALKDDDNDVRTAALNLISSICKDLRPE